MTIPRLHMNVFERIARTPPGNWFARRVSPRVDPVLLRMTGGRVSSVYPAPAMLLTTTGAKSGLPRTLPLLYVAEGDSLILIASNYGRPGHPAWYRNLTANPTVEVLAGKYSGTYAATEITDAGERASAWAKCLDLFAVYGDYAAKTDRTIPLIRLRRP